jgi:hypothetical protein
MSCDDGTSVTWRGVAESCLITFDGAWNAGQTDVNDFYGASGIQISGVTSASTVLLGGDINGDPGNWDVSDPAWGFWDGSSKMSFATSTTALKFEFERGGFDGRWT